MGKLRDFAEESDWSYATLSRVLEQFLEEENLVTAALEFCEDAASATEEEDDDNVLDEER